MATRLEFTVRAFLLAIAILLVAVPAFAVTSVDTCIPECEQHQLEWRDAPTQSWNKVGDPTDVGDITRSDNGEAARGVAWTGLSSYGEFRARATRIDSPDSGWSNVLTIGEVPEPPVLLPAVITTWDKCVPECETHQLQWRATPSDGWADIPSAVQSVGDITHADIPGGSGRGVAWTGVSSYGEFRAKALRADAPDSAWTPALSVGEAPAPPMLLSWLL